MYDYKTKITKSPMLVHIIWYVTPPSTISLTTELTQLSVLAKTAPVCCFGPIRWGQILMTAKKDTRTLFRRKKNIEKFDSQLS